MIDLKLLRENPQRFIHGAKAKNISVDISMLLNLDEQRRLLQRQKEDLRAQQNRISKEIGPQIGNLKGQLKSASSDEKSQLEAQLLELESKPSALKIETVSYTHLTLPTKRIV